MQYIYIYIYTYTYIMYIYIDNIRKIPMIFPFIHVGEIPALKEVLEGSLGGDTGSGKATPCGGGSRSSPW